MKNKNESKSESLIDDIDEVKSLKIQNSSFINHTPDLKSDEEIMVKSKTHLTNPSVDNLSRLEKIRKSSIFYRIFHKLREGSMRGVAILFIRLCIGVGILTIPYYMKVYGGVIGVVMLVLAALVNYFMYSFLAEVGNKTGIQDFLILNKRYAPKVIQNIFKITYMFDLVSSIFFYMIVGYNVFEYLACSFNLIPEKWYEDKEALKLKTYDFKVILFRFIYNIASFTLLLPFMFKKDLGALQCVTNCYIFVFIILCLFIFVEMGFFRINLQDMVSFNVNYIYSSPTFEWLQSFFGIMSTFYAQQYFFSIRKELMYPTTRRLRKMTRMSMCSLCIITLMIGKLHF
jgi:amino acid permease